MNDWKPQARPKSEEEFFERVEAVFSPGRMAETPWGAAWEDVENKSDVYTWSIMEL